jgi:hypothetical protein
MVRHDFNVSIFNAVTDPDYTGQILKACQDALCLAVSSMTCYQIRDGLNVCAAVREQYPNLPIIWGGYHPGTKKTGDAEHAFNRLRKIPNHD